MALTKEQKVQLADRHFQKISLSDEIMVIEVAGYIGESTQKESDYAGQMGASTIIRRISNFTKKRGGSSESLADRSLSDNYQGALLLGFYQCHGFAIESFGEMASRIEGFQCKWMALNETSKKRGFQRRGPPFFAIDHLEKSVFEGRRR